MIRMFGRMKKSLGWILLIVVLLLAQAYCDLALPSCTSKIIDTGISQKGIEDAVPETIRDGSMKTLLMLLPESSRKDVLRRYTKSNSLYRLRTLTAAQRKKLSDTLSRAEAAAVFAGQKGVDITSLPEPMIRVMTAQLDKMLKEYPQSIVTQAAVQYVASEYQAQNIDLGKMQTDYLLRTGGRMLLFALIAMICSILVAYLASRLSAGLGRDLRQDVYRKVLTFSSHEMNRFSTASLITRSTNDIQQVQMVITLMFRIVLYAPILAIGGLIRVSQTGSYLSWILAGGGGALAALRGVLFAFGMPRFRVLQSKIDRMNLISREILTGIPVIRAFSAEKREERRFDDANRDLTKTNLFVNRAMSLMMPAMMLIMNAISVLIIYSGAHGIDHGRLQVGDMMAFIQYAMQIIMAFLMISAIAVFMPRASVSARRINEVLDTRPMIQSPVHPLSVPSGSGGLLEFDHVSFRYPGAEEDVLKDISFTTKKGQTVALIGSTGSGKSTLVNLIPRFFDVTEGAIRVDGTDIRKMDLADLRERIGYVPQKSVLFSGTVESNLRFGRKDAAESELLDALSIAQADFVNEKEGGIRSRIAQGGSNLSGGQKQRIAIARAVAKRPEFYLFDDSFSALDFRTDAALRRALEKRTAGVTTIVVAQRISSILGADEILVLDEGRVVGRGTHKELMANCEVYQQIASSQLSADDQEAIRQRSTPSVETDGNGKEGPDHE